jgi:hypothetical protein
VRGFFRVMIVPKADRVLVHRYPPLFAAGQGKAHVLRLVPGQCSSLAYRRATVALVEQGREAALDYAPRGVCINATSQFVQKDILTFSFR